MAARQRPIRRLIAPAVAVLLAAALAVLAMASGGRAAAAAAPAGGAGATAVAASTGPTGPTDGRPKATAPPPVTVSPLPGTPDAMPETQISFLGAPISELHDIKVVGSRSGTHSGHLRGYASAPGASFVPEHPFKEGEHVTVTATVVAGKEHRDLRSSFEIGHPYTIPKAHTGNQPKGEKGDVLSFHSQPHLNPPAVDVTVPAANPALGDIFLSPDAGPGQEGAMIVEPSGQIVWFKPMPAGTFAMNLREQTYEEKPVLTWWQGEIVDGHGRGEDMIYNTSYQPVATVHAGNGLHSDLHEFNITPGGQALVSSYETIHANLTGVGGPSKGLMNDCVMQEIDIKTGLVMFEWHALGHVAVSDSYARVTHTSNHIYDFFHMNSLQQEADGNFLIDSRNMWAAYMIDHKNGAVLWRLGGRKSTFKLGPGVRFAWQHDAEILPDGDLSIFDDEDTPPEAKDSRALTVKLDLSKHTATLVSAWHHPGSAILAASQGSVQHLENGEEFVGWGQTGYASQFSTGGKLTFDMHLPLHDSSYRDYRFPWSATPKTLPALAVEASPASSSHSGTAAPAAAGTSLWASWNGATSVTGWEVLAGPSPTKLTAVGSFPKSGFETAIHVSSTEPWFQVVALGAEGRPIVASTAIKR